MVQIQSQLTSRNRGANHFVFYIGWTIKDSIYFAISNSLVK